MDISFETENNLKFLIFIFLTYPTDLDINFLILTSGNLKSLRVQCIVMFLVRWENLTAISFLGFSDRCQYLSWEKKEVEDIPWRKYTSVQIVHVPHICKNIFTQSQVWGGPPNVYNLTLFICYMPQVKVLTPPIHPPQPTNGLWAETRQLPAVDHRFGEDPIPSPLPKIKTVTCSRRQAWGGPPRGVHGLKHLPHEMDSPHDLSY